MNIYIAKRYFPKDSFNITHECSYRSEAKYIFTLLEAPLPEEYFSKQRDLCMRKTIRMFTFFCRRGHLVKPIAIHTGEKPEE